MDKEKYCPSCKRTLKAEKFGVNRSRKSGLQNLCKECKKKYDRERYLKDKSKQRDASIRNRKRVQDFFIEYKKNLVCEKCGENRWYALDFHHIRKENKDFNIADKMNSGYSIKGIMKEINKCITLCRNCHSEFHYLEKVNNLLLEDYINNAGRE